MQELRQAAGTWRIGIDLAAFVALAAIAGMTAAVTLAGIAVLLAGVSPSAPAPGPEAPMQAPARTMVAASPGARTR